MVELNLMPWRMQKLKYDKKCQRIAMMGGVLCAVIAWAILHLILQQQVEEVRGQLKSLQADLLKLTQQSKKPTSENNGWMPSELLQVLNMLSGVTENGVCYQGLLFENHEFVMSGQSLSMPLLLTTLKKIKLADHFSDYLITKIDNKERYGAVNFIVKYKELESEEN